MKRIYKYPIPVANEFVVAMPLGAEVLHVGVQDERPHLWALVDPDQPSRDYRFRMHGTGHPVEDVITGGMHIGTFMLGGGSFVGHIFQIER